MKINTEEILKVLPTEEEAKYESIVLQGDEYKAFMKCYYWIVEEIKRKGQEE